MTTQPPKSYTVAIAEAKGQPFAFKSIDLPKLKKREVLVKVLACGVCHSDALVRDEFVPNILPRIPGHEIVGDIVGIGEDVTRFNGGERVGGPWHGGHDGTCRSCQRGLLQMCEKEEINGVTRDGGYAEYVVLREEAVVRVPNNLDPAEVAPLLCAGVTVFNGMRKLRVESGSTVAIQGLGGLGHLAVQFSRAMGYKTIALSHGDSKRDFAHKLGAHEYIDTSKEYVAEKLKELGGADMICATAPNPKAIGSLTAGLAPGGKLLVLAAAGNIEFDTISLINGGQSVHGWPSGHALDSEETIAFAQLHGIKCLIERYPLKDANVAFEHMLSGKARFRVVLVPQ